MDYVNIVFPDCIALGAMRNAGWSTSVVTTVGGFDSTSQNWADAKHEYDIGFAIRTLSDYKAVVEHFHAARGRAKKWPFRDYLDFTANITEGVIVNDPNLGSDGGDRLAKVYAPGPDQWVRYITRPGAVTVYRTRSGSTSAIVATVDPETGEVSFAGHAPGDTYSWSGDFYVACRYDTDKLPGAIVNRNGSGEHLVEAVSIQIVEVRE